MITKETVVGVIEIIPETGIVQVRRDTYFVQDGVRVSEPSYHREVLEPGVAIDHQPDVVKAHAAVAWTPAIVSAHKDRVKQAGKLPK